MFHSNVSVRELSLTVVGLSHPNEDASRSNRRFEAALCVPGEPVTLIAEPTNPYDCFAVAAFSARGIQLGYLTAERAPWIRGLLQHGCQAVFQSIEDHAVIVRARFGGGAPTLPRPLRCPAERPDIDFQPDWGC